MWSNGSPEVLSINHCQILDQTLNNPCRQGALPNPQGSLSNVMLSQQLMRKKEISQTLLGQQSQNNKPYPHFTFEAHRKTGSTVWHYRLHSLFSEVLSQLSICLTPWASFASLARQTLYPTAMLQESLVNYLYLLHSVPSESGRK